MAHSASSYAKTTGIDEEFITAINSGDLDQLKKLLEIHSDIDISTHKLRGHYTLVFTILYLISTMKNTTHVHGIWIAKRKELLKYLLTNKKVAPYQQQVGPDKHVVVISLFRLTTMNASLTEYLVRDCKLDVNGAIANVADNEFFLDTALYYSMVDLLTAQAVDEVSAIKNNIIKLLTELKANVKLSLPAMVSSLWVNDAYGQDKITRKNVIDIFHKPLLKVIDELEETQANKKYLQAVTSAIIEKDASDEDTFEELKLLTYAIIEKLFGKRPVEDKAANEKEVKEAKVTSKEVSTTPEMSADEQKKDAMVQSASSYAKTSDIDTQFFNALSNGDLGQLKELLKIHSDINISTHKLRGKYTLVFTILLFIDSVRADGIMMAKRKEILKYLLIEKQAFPFQEDPKSHVIISLFRLTTMNASLTEYLVRDCKVDVNLSSGNSKISLYVVHTALYYSMLDLYSERDASEVRAIKNNISKLLTELKASVKIALPALLISLWYNCSMGQDKIKNKDVIDQFHKPLLKVLDELEDTRENKEYLYVLLSTILETRREVLVIDTFERLKGIAYAMIEKLFDKRPVEHKAADEKEKLKEAKTQSLETTATPEITPDEQKKSEESVKNEITKLAAKQKTIQEQLISAGAASTRKLKQFELEHKNRTSKFTRKQQTPLLEASKVVEEQARAVADAARQLEEESNQVAAQSQESSRLQGELTRVSQDTPRLQLLRARDEQRIADLQKKSASELKEIATAKAKHDELNAGIAICDVNVQKKMQELQSTQSLLAKTKKSISSDKEALVLLQKRRAANKSECDKLLAMLAASKSPRVSQALQSMAAKRNLLISDSAHANAELLDAAKKESDISEAIQQSYDEVVQQQASMNAQKQTLQQLQAQQQQRESALLARQKQLQIRNEVLQMKTKEWLESQQTKRLVPVKKSTGFQWKSVETYRHSLLHDQLDAIINTLIFKYLPTVSFTTPMLFIAGNLINDLLIADASGFRDKLILTDTNKSLDLPSCLIMPVASIYELSADSRLADARIEVESSGRKDKDPGLFQIKMSDVSLYLRQEVVNLERAAQDILRTVINKAVFTKDRVILQFDQISRNSGGGLFWFRDEEDLQALQKNELRLVDDLQSKDPMLSFSMVDDLLQLGREAKIIDPGPLRAWTEEFWNTVEYDLALNKKFRALEVILLDQRKLTAINLMHQYHIAEPMLFPENPGSELTAAQFNTMYRKISALQLSYLKASQSMNKNRESKEAAKSDALRTTYLSQVYGVLIAFYHAKSLSAKLDGSAFEAILNQFEPLFAHGLLTRDEVKRSLVSTHAQQKPGSGLSPSVVAFFEAAAPVAAASSATVKSTVDSPEFGPFT